MKNLNKVFFLLAVLLVSTLNMQAQDENNPWAISLGTNAVNIYSAGNDNIPNVGNVDIFDEYFNVNDYWNYIPAISSLEFRRYLGKDFTVRLSGSFNQITKLGNVTGDNLDFINAGVGVDYNFKNILNTKVFDPFLGIGVGYYWLDDNGSSTFDTDLGFNLWFTDNIAITLKSSYNATLKDTNFSYFQHTAGITVAFGGTDSDGDGIYDKNDKCPDTPGLAEFNGCPDSDGDGITDAEDSCPDTAGLPEFNGCPDTDGDGVADPKDECPTEAGIKALSGCPDADNDGIADKDDECPDTAGPKANNGCPYPDTDGDGVLDKDDTCPDFAGTQSNNGCPELTEEVQKELNRYAKNINFNTGDTEFSEASEEALSAIITIIEKYTNAKFTIEGHADSVGSEKNNMRLSEARALFVKSYLVENGVDEFRLSSAGYGESRPVATNNTRAGRTDNRRVEINLKK